MSQVTYTLELDEVGTMGAVFAATRDNTTVSSPPKLIVPKEDWVRTGRPTTVTIVMGEIDIDFSKHNRIAMPDIT